MKPETVIKAICAIGIATSAACFLAASFLPLPAHAETVAKPTPRPMMIVSEDDSGGEWISGRGDTCADAWENAVLPQGLTHVECVPDDGK